MRLGEPFDLWLQQRAGPHVGECRAAPPLLHSKPTTGREREFPCFSHRLNICGQPPKAPLSRAVLELLKRSGSAPTIPRGVTVSQGKPLHQPKGSARSDRTCYPGKIRM